MVSIRTQAHVGTDGRLDVQLPAEYREKRVNVTITFEPVDADSIGTPDERDAKNRPATFVESTAGVRQEEPPVHGEPVGAASQHSMESDIWQQARRESEALQAKWEREPRDKNGWPLSFIADTYGCLADDPIERLPQEPMSAALAAELQQWQALTLQAWEMFPYDATDF